MRMSFKSFYWILVTLGAMLVFFVLTPILFTFTAMFFTNSDLSGGHNPFILSGYSFESFHRTNVNIKSDPIFLRSLIKTSLTALFVAVITSISASVCSFFVSRFNFGKNKLLLGFAYFAYLTPPIILVLAMQTIPLELRGMFPKLSVLILAHCVYFFPFGYALFLGHWMQTNFSYDRSVASDGGDNFKIFSVHFFSFRSPSFVFFISLTVLIFMLSWSDVLFSRVILINEETRLLTDWFIDKVKSNESEQQRAELAMMSMITFSIAALISIIFAAAFYFSNKNR